MIPHSRPVYGQLVDGPATAELERRWCALTGMADTAAVGSGLAALRLALLALGVGPGDEVIVPAYSCVALLNAPLSIGAVPVLADVTPGEWTLDFSRLRITRRTRAIIAVNLFGVPARLEEVPVPVIEDCAHGPLLGRTEINVSSFYATKLVGAGMGGIVGGDHDWVEDVRRRRDYGDQEPDGLNLNDKMGEEDAQIAVMGLAALPDTLATRAVLASTYTSLLGARVTPPKPLGGRVWYRYTPELADGLSAARVVERMKAAGVYAEQPVWDLRGCRYWRDDLPVTSEAFDRLISLPLYPGLTYPEQQRVVEALEQAIA